MPQGKMKKKVKLPESVKKKARGKAVTSRSNAPIKSKGDKNRQAKKMKQAITKTVNEAAEAELRALAFDNKKSTISRNSSKSNKK